MQVGHLRISKAVYWSAVISESIWAIILLVVFYHLLEQQHRQTLQFSRIEGSIFEYHWPAIAFTFN